jgi:anti-sigma factor RsiW
MRRHISFELWSDYLDGSLAERERNATDIHLSRCAACRRELAQIRAVLRELEGVGHPGTPRRDLWPGIVHRLGVSPAGSPAGRTRPQRHRLRTYQLTASQLAAAALVLITLGACLGRWLTPHTAVVAALSPAASEGMPQVPRVRSSWRLAEQVQRAPSSRGERRRSPLFWVPPRSCTACRREIVASRRYSASSALSGPGWPGPRASQGHPVVNLHGSRRLARGEQD